MVKKRKKKTKPAKPFKKGHKKMGGRKKGTKNKETIEKEKALETYHQSMLQELMPLVRAQQKLAEGLMVVLRPGLVKNPKTRKLERTGELKQVRDPDEIEELFNSNGLGKDYHIVFAKDPNTKALQDIFDRVFGKAKESLDLKLKSKVELTNEQLHQLLENIRRRRK